MSVTLAVDRAFGNMPVARRMFIRALLPFQQVAGCCFVILKIY